MTYLSDLYRIEDYIDTFALGHYARVLSATSIQANQTVAFKVMRPEHLQADGEARWEFRAFINEAQILHTLRESPHVVKLLDCGYVSTIAEAPVDGEIASYGTDVATFATKLTNYAQLGWRPYLSLENLPRNENLFYAMKPAQPGTRRRLPSEEGITLALQFANVLAQAHAHKIVYLDHKLEHVYWDGTNLRIIDFNSSRQLNGSGNESHEYIKDIHNLCVGILYPIFTGMSPQKTSLRPQAGGMDVVEKRYEDVNDLDFSMEPGLSQSLQALLRRGAAQQIQTVQAFQAQLQEVGALHGRDFPTHFTSPSSRQARESMKKALKLLRDGESQVREARDRLRDAMVQDGITQDLEDELRRLIKDINDVLNQRIIP